MSARVRRVKFEAGFCEARGRPLLGQATGYKQAEHVLRNVVRISERQLPDRRFLGN
jgi:hypothetical protein